MPKLPCNRRSLHLQKLVRRTRQGRAAGPAAGKAIANEADVEADSDSDGDTSPLSEGIEDGVDPGELAKNRLRDGEEIEAEFREQVLTHKV